MKMMPDDVRELLLRLKAEHIVLNNSYNRLRDMRQSVSRWGCVVASRYDFDTRCLLQAAEGHVNDALEVLNFLEEERSKT